MKKLLVLLVSAVGLFVIDPALSQLGCSSNKVLDVASGNVTSPLYPANYPANQTCSWLLKAPQGMHIKLKINTIHIQDCGYDCNCDYLKIAIGRTATDRSNKYCQNKLVTGEVDLSKPIYSIYDKIWLNFHSNNEPYNHYKGFYATFEQINYMPPVCPSDAVVYSASNGSVRSPAYPKNYPASMHCYWLITVSAGSRVKLSFKDFGVEGTGCRPDISGNCNCDYVKVYDGETNATIAKLCGYSLPKPVVSSSNRMLIEFFSDSADNKKGFSADYQVTDDPPSTTKEPSPGITTATSSSHTLSHTLSHTTLTGLALTSTASGFCAIIITALLTLII